MTKKNSTQNETPKSLCRLDSSSLLHRIRHLRRNIQLRRRLFSTETYGHWGDFSQPKRTVCSPSHSSSVNMRGVLAESIASCCGCPAGCCRCQVRTPVHDPHRYLNLLIVDPIDHCECPPGFCRCKESVGSCFSPTSMELRGGFAISYESITCWCTPGNCQCEAKMPVHNPYRSLKLRTSYPIDLCKESVRSNFSPNYIGLRGVANNNEGSSCWCSPGYCRCEAKMPVHDPNHSFNMQITDLIDCCECPPGFCHCEESVSSYRCEESVGSCSCKESVGSCRCEESVGSCYEESVSSCYEESVSSWFPSTSMELRGEVIDNDGDNCGCPPGYCRCEGKTPVPDPI